MKITYNEFFLWLDDLSRKKNIKLSFSDKDFFFSLCSYCEEIATYDYEKECFTLEAGVVFLMNLFNIKSRSVIQNAINNLRKLGVLVTTLNRPNKTYYDVYCPYIELKRRT